MRVILSMFLLLATFSATAVEVGEIHFVPGLSVCYDPQTVEEIRNEFIAKGPSAYADIIARKVKSGQCRIHPEKLMFEIVSEYQMAEDSTDKLNQLRVLQIVALKSNDTCWVFRTRQARNVFTI